MLEINEKQIIAELPKHNNEIFMAMTPWHAKSIEATYLKYRVSEQASPLVVCLHNSGDKTVVSETNFSTLTEDTTFYSYSIRRFKNIKNALNMLFTILKFVFVRHDPKKNGECNSISLYTTRDVSPYVVMRIYNGTKHCKITNYVCDEGVASSYDAFSDEKVSLFKKALKSIVSKKISIVKDEILIVNGEKIIVNSDLQNRYQKVFKCAKVNLSSFVIPRNDYVLLCYAPISEETGMVDEKQFCEIVQTIVNTNNKFGRKTVIKIHPREKNRSFYEDLGCIIWDGKYSLEEIIANIDNKPKFIIGGISTGLITGNILFNIKSVSTILIYEKCNREGFVPEDADKCISDTKKFSQIYQQFITFPNNYNELTSIIS